MKVLDLIKNYQTTKMLLNKEASFVVEDTLGLALTLSSSFLENKRTIVVITPNLYNAQTLYEQTEAFLGKNNVLFYPFDEVIRVDKLSNSNEMLIQRLYVTNECLKNKPMVLITHLSSCLRNIPDKKLFQDNLIYLKKGNSYNIKDITNKLEQLGFLRVLKVDQPLQYALRGEVLDIYPINSNYPYRIEFFDVEIESIRIVDIASQLSKEANIQEITIFPSNEYLYDVNDYDTLKANVLHELELEKNQTPYYDKLSKKTISDLEKIKIDGFNDTLYPYYNFLNNNKMTILDYLNIDTLILFNFDKMSETYSFFNDEQKFYFEELFNNGLFLKNISYYNPLSSLLNKTSIKTISFNSSEEDIVLPLRSIIFNSNNVLKSQDLINKYLQEDKEILICLDKLSLKSFEDFLINQNINYRKSNEGETQKGIISLYEFDFNEGFELYQDNIVILTKKEIFGYHNYSSLYSSRFKKAEIITSFEELNEGDFVVHESYGIGKFKEITTLTFDDHKEDYLKIEYADNEYLYIPLVKFYLVRKYVSREGSVPKLSKIGKSDWQKTKKKIKEKINDITERLIQIYANREEENGYAFFKDDELQLAFENAFPFPLTSDQIRCVEEIKKDMESKKPMDRLLCGDVGFGKTEVAFRAAFKAILSHKQVMFLCPTTILAKQHYEVALGRFASFGVKIALFSRFIPLKIQKLQIEKIKRHEIDLIIGTHRLLSKDIIVDNLGLLIVDEEQRFGVEHKERIKEIAKNIDVLTLTATPIPRTLQMSLIGIRKISTIASAPLNRMPIQTYVLPYQEKFAIQVMERELSRKGQVFYVHNHIATIFQKANKIQNAIKNAVVGIVHGKMDKDDIDGIMDAYYQGKINILVCTSIIETGLDIANANTLIIEDADCFGLAQLYQIKGRVGRSSKVAYAYLFYNDKKELTLDAEKRLKAIKEFSELGSGYKIAQRDLTIRGAGDILGSEQSGFVDTIGMDMYLKIVQEVLLEKRGLKLKEEHIDSINITVSSYIPSKYASDKEKIQIYQEIQNVNSITSLELERRRIKDIYGRLPSEVEELLRKRKIDILAHYQYIESIQENINVDITLSKEFNNLSRSGILLTKELYPIKDYLNISFKNSLFVIQLIKDKMLLKNLEFILECIHRIGESYAPR